MLHHNIMGLKNIAGLLIKTFWLLLIIQYEIQIVPLNPDQIIITKTFSNVNKQLT